ncbi:MAG: SpoIIE family protein phosphatase, partial [Lachnospiraceae bacterium]|nr:SpoIIE family protein phosphatase [Lachnospiraceae bacterium]
ACIINNQGQLLFSSENTGELSITKETADHDLRDSDNKDLASLVTDAMNGLEAYRVVEVNGERYCAAFASMETVGWSFLIMIPEKTVQEPTHELMQEIETITVEAEGQTVRLLKDLALSMVVTGVIVIAVAVIMAIFISRYVVRPLQKLTEKVGEIEGDDLEFEWEDVKEDEIQTLAVSFKNMTQRMKEYIEEVTRITAEKEKIGAELSVATQIQADMLPRIFPPFPERREFDLYATMDPAKEVGGDFYDFFLIDNDHLGLVVADVSGKGVPAALFMVIAKTLIKNRALLGGSPSEVLSYANEQLCEGNEAELFVTVWFAIVEIPTGKGIAANAGHEHPAIKRAGGKWELSVYRHSPAVATMEGIRFREHEFELHPGDALYVYTDGVPEATNINDELFGPERMLESLNRDPDADVETLLKSVKKDVDDFTGEAPQFDDITMLGLIWNGNK